jgi:hypothetical protein
MKKGMTPMYAAKDPEAIKARFKETHRKEVKEVLKDTCLSIIFGEEFLTLNPSIAAACDIDNRLLVSEILIELSKEFADGIGST